MAFINHVSKEINVKIVYYGPGLSGKTTNIVYIHKRLKPDCRGKLISLATQTDRTLFFDFLPINMGEIGGYKLRFHLYTVPGQIFYNATRKMVLKGVDGIVFVADSQKQMLDDNIESLRNLEENLKEYGRSLEDIPFVIQFNKRDLPDAMDLEELYQRLNRLKVPFFKAVATEGVGVFETLTAICRLVIKKIKESTEFSSSLGEKEEQVLETKKVEAKGDYDKTKYLPEDYSDEAMKILDLLGEEEKEHVVSEEIEEKIEDELELFNTIDIEERKKISFEELNKNIFTQQALTYIETKDEKLENWNIEFKSPNIQREEIEIPIKLSFQGKEKTIKITLKFSFGDD